MANDRILFINGKFILEDSAVLSTLDRGLLYGDGLFETLRSINGYIVSYHDHMNRFRSGCELTGIVLHYTEMDIREFIRELLKKNSMTDAALIRITITRGVTENFGFGYPKNSKPTFMIHARPAVKIPPDLYEKGVNVDIQKINTLHSQQNGLVLKSLSAQEYVLAKQAALDRQCYEMILSDHFDNILEGTSSNIFIIKEGTVFTPPVSAGILGGITRKRVLDMIQRKTQTPFYEKIFTRSDLMSADEVFLTNTNVEILPVTKVCDKKIGEKIGTITQLLLNTFRQTLIEILE